MGIIRIQTSTVGLLLIFRIQYVDFKKCCSNQYCIPSAKCKFGFNVSGAHYGQSTSCCCLLTLREEKLWHCLKTEGPPADIFVKNEAFGGLVLDFVPLFFEVRVYIEKIKIKIAALATCTSTVQESFLRGSVSPGAISLFGIAFPFTLL